MQENIRKLREEYQSFRKGEKSNLAVKTDALLLLDKAKTKEDTEVVEEITDMLMDLELSISENKCNCHKGDSCC